VLLLALFAPLLCLHCLDGLHCSLLNVAVTVTAVGQLLDAQLLPDPAPQLWQWWGLLLLYQALEVLRKLLQQAALVCLRESAGGRVVRLVIC
jgi:hypothetical protein